jgi:dolichyl-phosphate-mannose--protein O-mannosyl transferase
MKLKLARWLTAGPQTLIHQILNFIKFHSKIFAGKMRMDENYPLYVHLFYGLRKYDI